MNQFEAYERIEKLETIINLLLDQVDYMAGNCRPNEAVGAILDKRIIDIARRGLIPPTHREEI